MVRPGLEKRAWETYNPTGCSYSPVVGVSSFTVSILLSLESKATNVGTSNSEAPVNWVQQRNHRLDSKYRPEYIGV